MKVKRAKLLLTLKSNTVSQSYVEQEFLLPALSPNSLVV